MRLTRKFHENETYKKYPQILDSKNVIQKHDLQKKCNSQNCSTKNETSTKMRLKEKIHKNDRQKISTKIMLTKIYKIESHKYVSQKL